MNDQQFKEFMELHRSMDWKLWEILNMLKSKYEAEATQKNISKSAALEGLFGTKKK